MSVKIVDFEPESKTPEYADDVLAVYESGQHGQITVSRDDIVTTLRKIHAAAKYHTLTARKVAQRDNGDTIDLVFKVGERVYRSRKNKQADKAETPESAE